MILKNENGQGLVEYLILVALIGIAAISTVRLVSQNIQARFSNVAYGLQGGSQKKKAQFDRVEERHYKSRDMSNFSDGTNSKSGSGDDE